MIIFFEICIVMVVGGGKGYLWQGVKKRGGKERKGDGEKDGGD